MNDIREGPNQPYADEYSRVNALIDERSRSLAEEFIRRGFQASPLPASQRTDAVEIRGDFPHKTAATRAGLGWIGKNCQLVTKTFGPWLRLGTVFTDMPLPCGPAIETDLCGRCAACVEACPADALTGSGWSPSIPRHELLDVHACDGWKKTHYFRFHDGHNCGICAAVCPFGLAVCRR